MRDLHRAGPGRRLVGLGIALAVSAFSAAHADEEWHYQLTPYAWLAGIEGEVGTVPDAPPAPVDIARSDVIDNIEMTLMAVFTAQRGSHGVYADLFYADIRADQDVVPPLDLSLGIGVKNTLLSLAYQYEFFRDGAASAAFLAGARYWRVENLLRLGDPASDLVRLAGSESWTDPLLGVKGSLPLGGSRWYLSGGAAIGGFGVGSDSFYEVTGALGDRWNDAISTLVGYRRFDVDYENSSFLYDVVQQGWQLGLNWSF
jgi:hypothetical protein